MKTLKSITTKVNSFYIFKNLKSPIQKLKLYRTVLEFMFFCLQFKVIFYSVKWLLRTCQLKLNIIILNSINQASRLTCVDLNFMDQVQVHSVNGLQSMNKVGPWNIMDAAHFVVSIIVNVRTSYVKSLHKTRP